MSVFNRRTKYAEAVYVYMAIAARFKRPEHKAEASKNTTMVRFIRNELKKLGFSAD